MVSTLNTAFKPCMANPALAGVIVFINFVFWGKTITYVLNEQGTGYKYLKLIGLVIGFDLG